MLDINITDNKIEAILDGRLDTVATAEFAKDMQPLLDNADKTITIDCKNLEYISSSGIRHLLLLQKTVDAKGGFLMLKNLQDEILKVLKITGLDKVFKIYVE